MINKSVFQETKKLERFWEMSKFICIKVSKTSGFTAYSIGDEFELIVNDESILVTKNYPDHVLLRHLKTGVISYHKKENFKNIQEIRDSKLKEIGI